MIKALQDTGIMASQLGMAAQEKPWQLIFCKADGWPSDANAAMAHGVGILASYRQIPREHYRDAKRVRILPCENSRAPYVLNLQRLNLSTISKRKSTSLTDTMNRFARSFRMRYN